MAAAGLVAAQAALVGMPAEIHPGKGKVDIVAWSGCIETGETDPAFDRVAGFEETTGCKFNVKTVSTRDGMEALINEGGFDLATASGDASLRPIADKGVQPIYIDLIPSWDTIDDRFGQAS